MANTVLVLGESGSGKSSSQEGLDPSTTFILNVTGKPLPFRGWKTKYSRDKKNYHVTHSHSEIISSLGVLNSAEFAHLKTIVIDDFQYVMSFEYMNRAKETGFAKFTEMAQHIFKIIEYTRHMRDDLTIVFLSHSDTQRNENGKVFTKMKTIGKLLDDKITLEGLFTVVLVADVDPMNKEMSHYFLTQNDGTSTAKSPRGMFENLKIQNDLNYVLNQINEYNNG
jgi:hypothetical protein